MRIDVLGPLAITDDKGQRRIEGSSPRASLLLASLACGADPVARTDLISRLWPGEANTGTPRDTNLNTCMSEARRLIDSKDALRSNKRARTVALARPRGIGTGVTTDVDVFRSLVQSESPRDWRSALEIARGRLLADLDREEDFPWLRAIRERLRHEHIAAVQRLTEWPLSTIEPLVDGFLENPGGGTLRSAVEAEEGRVTGAVTPDQLDLGDAAAQVAGQSVKPKVQDAPPARQVPLSRRRSVRAAALAAVGVTVIVVGVVLSGVADDSRSHIQPASGSVVDASTGKTYPPGSPVPKPSVPSGQVEAGRIIWACSTTKLGQCVFDYGKTEISARRGSTVAFLLRLHNPAPPRVSLLRLSVSATPSPGILKVAALLEWPATRGANNTLAFEFGHATTTIRVPNGGRRLAYVPGSTLLLSQGVESAGPGKPLARLPDGILSPSGIKLMNVGPPRGCWDCDLEYTRYVEFSARLT